MNVNAYDCPKCGSATWTRDLVQGVTPMLLRCRTGCGTEMAVSRCYKVPENHPQPTHEWYRQTQAQAVRDERRWPGSVRHWQQGGLCLREIETRDFT